MKIIKSKEFTAEKAWGALDIANLNWYNRSITLDRSTLYMAYQRWRRSLCSYAWNC